MACPRKLEPLHIKKKNIVMQFIVTALREW